MKAIKVTYIGDIKIGESVTNTLPRNPRNAGRKPIYGATVRVALRITPQERETLLALGNGNLHAGLRAALAAIKNIG